MIKHRISRGDTIVEVLIAITIASFAIGISYATAQKSLQQAITAGEHNEALNLLEQQLADLQLRYQNTPSANFESTFGYLSATANTNYCLINNATGPSNPTTWTPQYNYNNSASLSSNLSSNATTGPNTPYNTKCTQINQSVGASYYINISTSPSGSAKSPTLYHIVVRWSRIGSGETNQANLYYKLDGGQQQPLGYLPLGPPIAAAKRFKV